MKHTFFNWQRVTVVIIAITVTLVSIAHVLLAASKTPPGKQFLWTGHYYLDYFEYVSSIAAGARGDWLVKNYYATDDPSQNFYSKWQYLLLGKIGRVIHLGPIAMYWVAVVTYCLVLALLIFKTIQKILPKETFLKQLCAYLLSLFATPFYYKNPVDNYLTLIRFWNDKGTLLSRFPAIPYHLSASILTLLCLLWLGDIFTDLPKVSIPSIIGKSIKVSVVLLFLLTFAPSSVVLILGSFFLTWLYMFLVLVRKKQKLVLLRLFVLAGTISVLVLPLAFYFKTHIIGEYFRYISLLEVGWQVRLQMKGFILATGPLLLLSLLGILPFLRKLTPLRLLILSFVVVSYTIFFFPAIAIALGTTNTRFLSPVSYLLFGALTVLPIKRQKLLLIISAILLLYFTAGNLEAYRMAIHDQNITSPISYLPKGLLVGLTKLNDFPDSRAVLTTPSLFLGAILPIFAHRNVYLARPDTTPNYLVKNIETNNFYLGTMDKETAYDFIKRSGVGYVILTSVENYSAQPLYDYGFLEVAYKNKDITIFKVKPKRFQS